MLIALATITYVALLIGALGVMSLVTNTAVIDTPGLTAVPGAVAVAASMGAFVLALRAGLRPPHPSFVSAFWAGLAAMLAYLVGVWITAIATGTDVAVATSVVGRLVLGWAAVTVWAAAALTAWGTIALARTGSTAPKWPWESDDSE